MKIIKGNYGECRFCDNMDEEFGLPSLEEKSWDLCLTDPPYNVNAKGNSQKTHKNEKWKTPTKIDYDDNIEDFKEFNMNWINNCLRISKGLIFTPGNVNLQFWFQQTNPRDILFHRKPNGAGITSMCFQNRCEIILCYGIFNRKFLRNIYSIYLRNGFLREDTFLHPHPKSLELYRAIIKDAIPQSVIDPFLGSGTTAEVCESLGIPWLGFELMEDYAPDIEKRIQRGIIKKKYATKQQTLF